MPIRKRGNTFIPGILFALLSICNYSSAQKAVPLINSYKLLTKGLALIDTGQYDKASDLFEQISRNDTNYALAIYEDAISRISGGEDSLAVGICRKGIALHTEYSSDFYKFLSSAYINMDKDDDAIKLLKDTAIPAYPNVYLLQYSMGLAYYKSHKYDSAIACFERSINLNIFHASSHYYLGKCCLEQGRMIPALLSLQFYLLLEPATSRSFATVQLVEQVTEGKYDYNKATVVDPSKYNDDAFADLDQIIKSKIGLSDDYKAKTKVSFGVIKQCQLMLEKLTYTPNTNNFWMEEYVPFYNTLQTKNYFEPYAYYIMGSVNNDDLQKDISKNKRKITDFTDWAGKMLAEKRDKREVTVSGVKKTLTCIFYDNNLPEGVGEENAKGKSIGDWLIYNRYTGNIEAKGSFNANGNKEGEWVYYYFDGALKEKSNYVDDKHEGVSEVWYRNGAQKGKYTYHNDKLNGEVSEYNASGILTTHGNYVNDKPTSEFTIYYNDGKTHYTSNYTDAGLDGELKEFYITHQLTLSSVLKNGKKNGTATDFWPNGKIKDEVGYIDDYATNTFKYYYEDGTLNKVGAYGNNGKEFGLWTTFYRNGKKEEEYTFNKNGEWNGPDSRYDDDEVKYAEMEYKNNELQHIIYFDKSGKTIFETSISGGKLEQQNFYPNGVKMNEGETVYGKKTGKWKFYSVTGALTNQESYKNGLLDGMRTDYYADGKVKDSLNYTRDSASGLYHEYFENGQLMTTGWFVGASKEGDWYYYNARGTLTSHIYYLDNTLYGYADYYDVNGRLSSEELTNSLGYFDKAWIYDTTGTKVVYTYISDKGNGTYKPAYANGQLKIERPYIAGNVDGHQKAYFYNGKLKAEGDFLGGSRQGKLINYYNNGNVESVFNYDIGNATGPATRYFENGKTKFEENFLSDNEDGTYKEYYKNGKLRRIGQYNDGEKDGETKFYFEDSTIYCFAWYHNGLITGYSYPGKDGNLVATIPIDKGTGNMVCYYANGTKSLECKYDNSVFDGKRIMYTPAGKVYEDENYQSGDENGLQKYYYADGKLKAEENFYLGDMDGTSTYYYETGKPEHTENWVLGKRHGAFKYYDASGKLIKTTIYYNDEVVTEK